ncbi:TPA: ethanolamine utilization protein EutJ [Escherichia coli]|nr:ethanolamine utilization protein EutJ [Escherichia coli]
MNQQDIEQVVKAVLLKMQSSDTPSAAVHEMGVFASLDDAVAAAKVAQQGLKSVAMRQLAIAAIREAGEKHARDLAELAVSETGMGRVEDKFAKNVAQARGTPGVECLSPQVLTGDNGLTLIENAPWGVVASVTPSTNPAATVINNAISLIAAGNSVIFAPHPAAKKVSQRAITLLNQAIVAAGGPENLLVTVANPDIETAQRLFKFPGIGLLVVTGGEAVVEAARKHTNKRLIAAGAGNPPVVVDETADLARAAQSIVKGASFDNNIICADEKVLIVVDSVADELMRLMEGQHAVKLTAEQAQQLQPVLLKNIDERGKGTVSRDWVGRDAGKIAAAIGLKVPQETRLLFVETTAEHPFAVTELMMPVLPVVRVANVADAIALAVKLEGGCHHTAATLCNQTPAATESPLWLGVDLGTCDVVSMVVDRDGQPVAVCLDWADVVRDGIVWDFFGAVTIVRRHLDTLEQQFGRRFSHAATSFPPGTDPRISINVLESAGLEVSHVLDEPTAVADLLQLDNAGVVDIGGGTTGIAIVKKGKVTYSADEATGGHHISLTLAGNRRISLEEAEQYKRGHGEEIWPAVKPVYEKMADIVARHIEGQGITDLWLAGGSCMQPGVAELFRKQFPALQVHLPQHSLFMTPLAIASSGREKAEGLYAK